jgi:hypothetical protein
MDLGQLLFLLLFFILPLLMQWLERRGRADSPPEPGEVDPGREAAGEVASARRERVEPGEPVEPGWSDGWGEWPTVEEVAAGEIAAEEVVDEERALELAALQERLPPEEVPEAVRVSAPVVSLESPAAARASTRRPSVADVVPPRRSTPPRLAVLLRTRGEVRRAVLLAEVLRPPRALD